MGIHDLVYTQVFPCVSCWHCSETMTAQQKQAHPPLRFGFQIPLSIKGIRAPRRNG